MWSPTALDWIMKRPDNLCEKLWGRISTISPFLWRWVAAPRHIVRKTGVPVKPGLYQLLDYLDEHRIPYAVATSTKGENARFRLDNIGVLSRLSGLITGDMVVSGKPDPEIFTLAAKALETPPAHCLVLEDSPHGILAAHRAGCQPMMIPDLKEPGEETLPLLFAQGKTLLDVIPVLEENAVCG